jgi:trk system potassium uptake protein
MYIIIVGDNYLSVELVKRCVQKDNKVVLVIEHKDRIADLHALNDVIMVEGPANEMRTYDDLNLHTCDIFVASTDRDDGNLIAAIYAKEMNAKSVFVKCSSPSTATMLEKIGIYPFIPELYFSEFFSLLVKHQGVGRLLTHIANHVPNPQVVLVERPVQNGSGFTQFKLGEIKGEFFNAIAMFKDGIFFINPEAEVFKDSVIIFIVDAEKKDHLDKELKAYKKKEVKSQTVSD